MLPLIGELVWTPNLVVAAVWFKNEKKIAAMIMIYKPVGKGTLNLRKLYKKAALNIISNKFSILIYLAFTFIYIIRQLT